jgi:alkylhydroperoxidase family enzyme
VVEEDLLPVLRDAAWDDERLTDRERVALRYTETFWHDHRQVGPDLVHEVLEHFSEPEFIELAVMISQFMGMGQLFAVLGIPNPAFVPEPEFREAP